MWTFSASPCGVVCALAADAGFARIFHLCSFTFCFLFAAFVKEFAYNLFTIIDPIKKSIKQIHNPVKTCKSPVQSSSIIVHKLHTAKGSD